VVEIIIKALDAENKRSSKRRKVRYERVRSADGTIETRYRLDFAAADFGTTFGMVFQSAVNKARRENKRVIGAADVEPDRG
jgi:hypothetical protein